MVRACEAVGPDEALVWPHGVQGRSQLCEGAATEGHGEDRMTDKLVVGYQEFVRSVSAGLEATDQHSCQEQDGVDYKAMAKTLWASGYRFDATARIQWLVVEMRSRLSGNAELTEMFAELLALAEVEGNGSGNAAH